MKRLVSPILVFVAFHLVCSLIGADDKLGVRVVVRPSSAMQSSHAQQIESKVKVLLKGLGASESHEAQFTALVVYAI